MRNSGRRPILRIPLVDVDRPKERQPHVAIRAKQMIIEFFGPPGGGKSAIARAVFNELRDRGYATEIALVPPPDRAWSLHAGGFMHATGRLGRAAIDILAMA